MFLVERKPLHKKKMTRQGFLSFFEYTFEEDESDPFLDEKG